MGTLNVKVKLTLKQATKAERLIRGIARLFNLGTRWGWVVIATPRLLYPRKRDPAWWAPEPIWTGVEYLAHTELRFPDRPARSESLYGLSYPGQHYTRRRTFLTVSRWILPSMKNLSDKICRGNQNTRFMFNNPHPKIVQFMR